MDGWAATERDAGRAVMKAPATKATAVLYEIYNSYTDLKTRENVKKSSLYSVNLILRNPKDSYIKLKYYPCLQNLTN